MSAAALVLGLLGAVVLVVPIAFGVPLEIAAPFTAPLGGGLAVMALVLAGTVILSRERRRRAPRLASVSLVLAIAGVISALGLEGTLIRREKAAQARAAADKKPPAEKARDDQQFDKDLTENLGK